MKAFINRRIPELLGLLTGLVFSFFVFPLSNFWIGSVITLLLLIAADWFLRR